MTKIKYLVIGLIRHKTTHAPISNAIINGSLKPCVMITDSIDSANATAADAGKAENQQNLSTFTSLSLFDGSYGLKLSAKESQNQHCIQVHVSFKGMHNVFNIAASLNAVSGKLTYRRDIYLPKIIEKLNEPPPPPPQLQLTLSPQLSRSLFEETSEYTGVFGFIFIVLYLILMRRSKMNRNQYNINHHTHFQTLLKCSGGIVWHETYIDSSSVDEMVLKDSSVTLVYGSL